MIHKVDTAGAITTVAGTGTCGYSGDGGPATSAQIRPGSDSTGGRIALDSTGNIYLADTGNGRIREITTSGTITTIASNGSVPTVYTLETATCSGGMAFAAGVTVVPDGTVYVACPYGIGKVPSNGTLQQIFSTTPATLASDASGKLYFSGYFQGVINTLDPATGTVTTISTLAPTLGLDSNGKAPIATDLAVSSNGTVYAALSRAGYGSPTCNTLACQPTYGEVDRHIVVRIDDGVPVVIAGTGNPDPDTGVQSGYGRDLSLNPFGIALDSDGGLLISSGHSVYRIAYAGPDSDSDCAPARFHPGADLTNLDLHRVRASQVIGAPLNMPTSWQVRNGFLLGPTANLAGFDLTGMDLTGLDLTGTKLTGTLLSGTTLTGTTFATATGTPTGGSTAAYSNTTCPDATVATSPATCVGHGFGN